MAQRPLEGGWIGKDLGLWQASVVLLLALILIVLVVYLTASRKQPPTAEE